MLTGIAYGAQIVNFEAVLTLYNIAEDEASRISAIELAKSLTKARPELAQSINQTLSQLGVDVAQ